jgi:hypothetical protein
VQTNAKITEVRRTVVRRFLFPSMIERPCLNLRAVAARGRCRYSNRSGSVRIDPEETGIVTHVLQRLRAIAAGDRRAGFTNFVCRGVLMLSTSFRFSPPAAVTITA